LDERSRQYLSNCDNDPCIAKAILLESW
jgi:hypothetical protein